MRLPTSIPSILRPAAAGLTLVLCLQPAVAFGQTPSLAELAQKEQARRKTLTGPTKVYSDKDLPRAAPAATADSPELPPATAAPPAEKADQPAKPEEAKDQKNEEWWRARMAQAREAQRRAETFAEALQSRINALSADAVNIDDPYQRGKAANDRQKAIDELARVNSEIDQAKKEIVNIEEEARKASVPPGWIR